LDARLVGARTAAGSTAPIDSMHFVLNGMSSLTGHAATLVGTDLGTAASEPMTM
jgi:hypothetical protein